MYGYGYRYNSGLVLGAGGGAPFVNTYSTLFDGVDDYVQLGENNSDLQPTGAFSLSVWVKFYGLSSIQGIWEATSNVGVFGGDGYIIWKSSANKFQFYMRQGTSWKIATGTTTVTTGTWYHILCTWDGSTTSKIFVNGIEEGSQSVTSINYNANTGINLGGYQSESITKPYQIEGNIDEASIFNSVVDIADVWDGSGVPTDLTDLSPLGWWRFEEGMGTTAIDSGSGGNDGTLTNGVAYSTNVP